MSELDLVINDINKKYGDGTIRFANEFPKLVRVPTGVFSLDVEIGGGLPKGRTVMFTGNESTGKTTVAKKAIAQFQTTCKHCIGHIEECGCNSPEPHKAVFVDMEGAFDPSWFTTLGGNLDELLLIQPEFAEQACDVVEALIRTGGVDIIVIDSIAMMSPADEIDKSSEDLLVGTHARLVNRMMRSIQAGMNSLGMVNERKPAVVLINQVRHKVGVMYGSPDTYPGGLGQKFASSITVKFTSRQSERIYNSSDKKSKDSPPVGITIRFSVEKNKTFIPFRSGLFVLYVDSSEEHGSVKGSVDTIDQVIQYGVRYGFIEKSGGWFTLCTGNKDYDIQYHGKNGLYDALQEKPEIVDELAHLISEKIINDLDTVFIEEE